MAIFSKEIIKSWFLTGLKPTQQQFHNAFDSFWHKDEALDINNIDGLSGMLNRKYDKTSGDSLEQRVEALENNPVAPDVDFDYKLAIDFTYYSTAQYIAPDDTTISSVKLVNTGEVKLWIDGVVVATIPAQEATDSGTVYSYELATPVYIAEGSIVLWTIARDADNLTPRLLTIL